MWVFLNNAMLSIVAHRTKPRHFMVRARLPGDLERVFPRAKVTTTPLADYRYRCTVTRKAAAAALVEALEQVDYPNFKDSVADLDRHDAYLNVWSAMHRAQRMAADPGQGGRYQALDSDGVAW